MASTAVAVIEPPASAPVSLVPEPNIDAFLQLETVGITDLYEFSLQKLAKNRLMCGIVDESVYRCRLCTRFDNCVVRGKKMLSSKASRLHYAAHMLTYKALLRFESPEVLCPVCDTLIFTAGSGEPLIELELINHIESEHAEVVLNQLSPATLNPVQCQMIFGVSSGVTEVSKKLRRKNYAFCLICGCDIFSRYRIPQAQHYFEWILEDHLVSHISNAIDPKPDLTYNCKICSSVANPSTFKGAIAFLHHLFSYHRKKIELACANNTTDHIWSAYNNLYIRIFGALAPLTYRLVHGGTLNPFDAPLITLKDEEEKGAKSLYPFSRKTGNSKKKGVVVEPVRKIECCREECGHKEIDEDDLAMVKHVILHMKHDEYRMKHNKEGTVPVWCCPQADKIFTVGELLIHFVSVHFYDNEMVEMPLFTFVLTRCKDIFRTMIKGCFGDRVISPFKVMALLIDMSIDEIKLPGWIRVLERSEINETFVELWANVMCSRNLDAEDADQICFAVPFSSISSDDNEIMWIDKHGQEVQKKARTEWDSDPESDNDEEDSPPLKCEVVPMIEVIVSVRRFRYELREKLPFKEVLLSEPLLKRKRRVNPKRSAAHERIVVELREGPEIDPFNLCAHESENSKEGRTTSNSESSDEPSVKISATNTKWTPRQLIDDFLPGSGTVMLTGSSPTCSNGITIGQMTPDCVTRTRKGRPRGSYSLLKHQQQRKLSDLEATRKLDSALESFITDTVNTIMPAEARESFDFECPDRDPSPPKMTLHELIMEQIEKDAVESFLNSPELTSPPPIRTSPPPECSVPSLDVGPPQLSPIHKPPVETVTPKQENVQIPVKRGRGRPRKHPVVSPLPELLNVEDEGVSIKRAGRPRKIRSINVTVL